MKKNATIYTAFISNKEKTITTFSLNKDSLDHYINSISKEDPFTKEKYHIYKKEIIIRAKLMENIHKALYKACKEDELYVIDTVRSEEELFTWIAVKGEEYKAESAFDEFLIENNLLNEWIDGKLKIEVCHSYKESSKEFGYRTNYQKEKVNIDNHEKIWNLSELFDGINDFHIGDYAKYSYTKECRITNISIENKEFKFNEDWLKALTCTMPAYSAYKNR